MQSTFYSKGEILVKTEMNSRDYAERQRNALHGLDRRETKKFTMNPVNNAVRIVPSPVPIILPSSKNKDSAMEKTTQIISNAILTLPNFFFKRSVKACTKASPEFMTTLAITERATPRLKMTIPARTIIKRKK